MQVGKLAFPFDIRRWFYICLESIVKKIIKGILKRFGIVAFKRSSRVYLPEDDSYRVAVEQCGKAEPVIIDGGAHKGGSVMAFSEVVPRAEYHCFEPDPVLVREISELFSDRPDVHVVAAALGESSGKATFNINVSRPTNSLLPAADNLQADIQGLCQVVEQVEVEVMSVDAYCEARGIRQVDILKLDLQGYDYKALLGAKATLREVKVVLVEVLFAEIYKGCHLFPDILGFMSDCGFNLYTLCGIHYGKNDELLWADAIFVRRESAH